MRMIASGHLSQGDLLPSVRTLAQRLEVNPMTISKAYSLLESQGVVERQRGKGMAVAEPPASSLSAKQRMQLLSRKLEEARQYGKQLNLTQQQIQQAFAAFTENNNDD